MVRFNAGEGRKARRRLEEYIGGYIDVEKRHLRDQGTAHTLLEFTHAKTGAKTTIGTMIVYKQEIRLNKAFLIADLPATADLLMAEVEGNRVHLTFSQLQDRAREYRKGGTYFKVFRVSRAYRRHVAQRLGGLPAHFFSALCHIVSQDYVDIDLDELIRETLLGSTPISGRPVRKRATVIWKNTEGQDAKDLLKDFLTVVPAEHEKIKAVLDDVSKMIRKIQFGPWRCRFTLSPVSPHSLPLSDDLILAANDYKQLRDDPTVRDAWKTLRSKHETALDRLVSFLTADDDELSYKEVPLRRALLTPSRHFTYDLELHMEDVSGWARLAPLIGWIGERERQMFVQVVLVAAMLRAYEDHPSRPRLVLIPEALSRRPDVLAAVLRLMRELELQPIVTAPVGAYAIEKAMDYTVRLYRDPETPEQPRCIQKRRLGPRLDEAQSRQ
jgi:hypothetical protein